MTSQGGVESRRETRIFKTRDGAMGYLVSIPVLIEGAVLFVIGRLLDENTRTVALGALMPFLIFFGTVYLWAPNRRGVSETDVYREAMSMTGWSKRWIRTFLLSCGVISLAVLTAILLWVR